MTAIDLAPDLGGGWRRRTGESPTAAPRPPSLTAGPVPGPSQTSP